MIFSRSYNAVFVVTLVTDGFFSKPSSQSTVADLHRVNQALTERVAEKELALKHQRNTNRYEATGRTQSVAN